jgi:hypothetical protein
LTPKRTLKGLVTVAPLAGSSNITDVVAMGAGELHAANKAAAEAADRARARRRVSMGFLR